MYFIIISQYSRSPTYIAIISHKVANKSVNVKSMKKIEDFYIM